MTPSTEPRTTLAQAGANKMPVKAGQQPDHGPEDETNQDCQDPHLE
jgi:hypothetical protein